MKEKLSYKVVSAIKNKWSRSCGNTKERITKLCIRVDLRLGSLEREQMTRIYWRSILRGTLHRSKRSRIGQGKEPSKDVILAKSNLGLIQDRIWSINLTTETGQRVQAFVPLSWPAAISQGQCFWESHRHKLSAAALTNSWGFPCPAWSSWSEKITNSIYPKRIG